MVTEVFIGNLDDPDFDYDAGQEKYSGNIPKRRGEPLPNGPGVGNNVFRFVNKLITNGEIQGKQVDWGATVSPLYPEEIYNVFKNYYESKELGLLERRLKKLDQEKKYALVACELW